MILLLGGDFRVAHFPLASFLFCFLFPPSLFLLLYRPFSDKIVASNGVTSSSVLSRMNLLLLLTSPT